MVLLAGFITLLDLSSLASSVPAAQQPFRSGWNSLVWSNDWSTLNKSIYPPRISFRVKIRP
ncbi:hypothetical protein K435DRAFT_208503 [Dendrothele bispora CBS 962.96]|uniref:Uncharacterized protein n=1 Tax=Dendrothele bispora (strain CBS 962.96) TaxID=1314807 RepID=A0A4V4HEV7_DENBC|nr:hypothetical protein K435DRAFT_208503 [Dendrothele bispora CBS 962.96]